jgi:hypothetical protein
VWVNASPQEEPSSRNGWSAGAVVAARYALPIGPLALEMGPEFEVLAPPLSVDVDAAEVLRLPAIIASIAVDVSTR